MSGSRRGQCGAVIRAVFRGSLGPSRPLRALVSCALGLAAVVTYGACGFDGKGTGPAATEPLEAGAAAPGAAATSGAPASDAGDFQTACTAERTVCSGVCTDTTSDPDNCSACAKACPAGQTCVDAGCGVLCLPGTIACAGACVDTKTSNTNCGQCGQACSGATPFCVGGVCVPNCQSSSLCPAIGAAPAYCADLTTDRKNCGTCGTTCAANETCTGTPAVCKALCTTGSLPADVFAPNMVGCTGKITFAKAATLCPAGTTVCTPAQYVARHAAKKPTYNYWTSVNLGYDGSPGDCSVAPVGTSGYSSCNNPMRVCAGNTDPLGNKCNGLGCGYLTRTNQYFGGCTDDTTAGTLCCSP